MENRDMGEKPLSSFNEILALVFVFHSSFLPCETFFYFTGAMLDVHHFQKTFHTVLPAQKIT